MTFTWSPFGASISYGDEASYLTDRSLQVFGSLPTPPFTAEEKKLVADEVYAHVWQQAMTGGFALDTISLRFV
jgi:hypothetical protein